MDDIEKYNFYLNASFEFHDSILFSNIVKKPSNQELSKIKSKLSKSEIERLYNHFHMSALSEEIDQQRIFAYEIWKKWRSFFNKKLQENNIVIEIFDTNDEVIIFIFEKTN